MEPERRDTTRDTTYTHIERDSKGGSGMAFIVGGLVVAVALIAVIVWGGGFGTWDGDADVEISTQSQVPAGPAVENKIEVAPSQTTSEPAAAPAPAEPAAPAAPAEPAKN